MTIDKKSTTDGIQHETIIGMLYYYFSLNFKYSHMIRFFLLILGLSFIPTADAQPPVIDAALCDSVQKLGGQLPVQVTAFYGVKGIQPLEDVMLQLKQVVEEIKNRNPNLLRWHTLDFEDIALECSLNWEKRHLDLFKKIGQMVAN